MPKVDLDFQRYVERRKGAREAQAREGAAYAYSGDLKVLRTLTGLKPVRLAMEATERLWKSAARAELLNGGTQATARILPRVHAGADKCAQVLHIAVPAVYVVDRLPSGRAQTLGTNEDPSIVLEHALVDELTDAELADLIGRECGRIQNNHVVFGTALYYLTNFTHRFFKWIVTPATLALSGWSRRADLTADRAGLLCTRALDVSEAALTKASAPGDPRTIRRIEALRLFAGSAYYRGIIGEEGGLSAAETDARVVP